jgi:hypothetical protein
VTGRALVLALAVPFLFLHIKYQPGVRVRLGSTHLGIEASDLAVVVVALVALREGLRAGFAPCGPHCRSGLPPLRSWCGSSFAPNHSCTS